jgi:hypothetical protein
LHTGAAFFLDRRLAAGFQQRAFLVFTKNCRGMLRTLKTLETPSHHGALHRIRRHGSIRGFTFQPAGFGKNRKSSNESTSRDCIASCPLWKGDYGGRGFVTAQTAGLLCYFLSGWLPERGYGSSKFKGSVSQAGSSFFQNVRS